MTGDWAINIVSPPQNVVPTLMNDTNDLVLFASYETLPFMQIALAFF